MKTVFINRKRYTVEHIYNMVGNYHFTDKNGVVYLVDGEDVSEFVDDNPEYQTNNGLLNAIGYARYYAANTESGVFWWAVKNPVKLTPAYWV